MAASRFDNVLSHFEFFEIAKKMRIDLAIVLLVFRNVFYADRFFSVGRNFLLAYVFVIGSMPAYPAERVWPPKRQKDDMISLCLC